MHRLLFLFILLNIFGCQPMNSHKQVYPPDWLTGHWQRTNDKEGRETFENWEKIKETDFRGLGFTLSDGDTVFIEHLRIHKPDSLWVFEVTGVNESPTIFTLTESDSTSFTATNPENEFPKIIHYEKSLDGLRAEIAGGDMEVGFDFIPK